VSLGFLNYYDPSIVAVSTDNTAWTWGYDSQSDTTASPATLSAPVLRVLNDYEVVALAGNSCTVSVNRQLDCPESLRALRLAKTLRDRRYFPTDLEVQADGRVWNAETPSKQPLHAAIRRSARLQRCGTGPGATRNRSRSRV
jgi:hypothetical protein